MLICVIKPAHRLTKPNQINIPMNDTEFCKYSHDFATCSSNVWCAFRYHRWHTHAGQREGKNIKPVRFVCGRRPFAVQSAGVMYVCSIELWLIVGSVCENVSVRDMNAFIHASYIPIYMRITTKLCNNIIAKINRHITHTNDLQMTTQCSGYAFNSPQNVFLHFAVHLHHSPVFFFNVFVDATIAFVCCFL